MPTGSSALPSMRCRLRSTAIFSAGQSGDGDTALSKFRCKSRWDGCVLWTVYRLCLLYFEYASGVAEVRTEPLVCDGGWGIGGVGICALRGYDAGRRCAGDGGGGDELSI